MRNQRGNVSIIGALIGSAMALAAIYALFQGLADSGKGLVTQRAETGVNSLVGSISSIANSRKTCKSLISDSGGNPFVAFNATLAQQAAPGGMPVTMNLPGGVVVQAGADVKPYDVAVRTMLFRNASSLGTEASTGFTIWLGRLVLSVSQREGAGTSKFLGPKDFRERDVGAFVFYVNGSSQLADCTATAPQTLDALDDVTLSAPGANQVLAYNGTQWVNRAESDPKIGDVGTSGRLCRTDGARVICDQVEGDPKIGTLEAGKYCTSDGTRINCNADPPNLVRCATNQYGGNCVQDANHFPVGCWIAANGAWYTHQAITFISGAWYVIYTNGNALCDSVVVMSIP